MPAPQTDCSPRGAALLTGEAEGFQTAVGIHGSLAELYKLLAANRISAQRAAVLAHISNLMLRTLPAVERELSPSDPSGAMQIDFGDLPPQNENRPSRLRP